MRLERTKRSVRGSDSPGVSRPLCLALAGGFLALALCGVISLPAGAGNRSGPRFTKNGELLRPHDYREWVYLTSGLGMTYGPAAPTTATHSPMFDNVFVNREAYREFLRTGIWPEKSMLILEVRRSEEKVSINNGGRTQGEVVAIEAAVKDRKRFPEGGWGYFSFDADQGLAEKVKVLPQTASCYPCHQNKAAVEHTFVQFYPTLFEVAKRLGTVKPSYGEK